MTLKELYTELQKTLEKAPNSDSDFEAFCLLHGVLGITRGELYGPAPGAAREVEPSALEGLRRLARRRLEGEPLQYLLGEWEFYGLPLLVGPGVLIPRPETELLVDLALSFLEGVPSPAVLDLCAGSGCIPIAVGSRRPDAALWGVELSPPALDYFRRNVALNGAGHITPVAGDVLNLPWELTQRRYHVITSNPPYLSERDMAELQTEVAFEPAMALDGGGDGLSFYRALPGICLPLLEPGGMLLLEIGEAQGPEVAQLLTQAGYQQVTVHRDYSGLDRIVTGRSSL